MHAIGLALAAIAKSEPDVVIVVPVHRNPIVREALLPTLVGLDNVVICEPLAYGEFVHLISRADLIVTDSGGLQEEGPTIGKPVLVMRDTTERPEAVAAGGVRLVGTHTQTIVENIRELLHDNAQYAAMAIPRDVYGDGRAATRSISAITHLLGSGLPATEFVPGVKELLPV
jgi:UDP-N-acetylglucosamine 2-epimerase (non-hydrolysing)